MTKEEFSALYRVANRNHTRRLFVLTVICWGITIPLIIWVRPIIEYIGQQDWALSLAKPSVLWGVAGCFTIALGFGVRALGNWKGMPCPNCGKQLAGASANIAVFTGNCGFCGELVVEDNLVASAHDRASRRTSPS